MICPVNSCIISIIEPTDYRRRYQSKSVIRIVLSALVSLGVILAVYTSVQAWQGKSVLNVVDTKPILVGSVKVNHDRLSVSELEIYQAQMENYPSHLGKDGGCESEWQGCDD